MDLGEAAAAADDRYLSSLVPGPFGKTAITVRDENRLDLDVEAFERVARTALRRRVGLPAGALLATDPDVVDIGISDAFALGRHDPDAFLLLAALFRRLPAENRSDAVLALTMATHHPDIAWSKTNWIPNAVEAEVKARTRWSADDLDALLDVIDDRGVQRGTIGQAVYHVLELDRQFEVTLFGVATDQRRAPTSRFWAAAVLTYRAGDQAGAMLDRLTDAAPDLTSVDYFDMLEDSVAEHGQVWLF